jgi:hypothetical protein
MYKTGLEELVKFARAGAPAPAMKVPSVHNHPLQAARAGVMSSPSVRPAQRPAPQDVAPSGPPASLPEARTIRDDLKGPPSGGGGGGGNLPPLPPTPSGPSQGFLSKFRPGRALGLAGLGAAGAIAYGMHRSNQNDRERHSLVYAPMQGSMMQ